MPLSLMNSACRCVLWNLIFSANESHCLSCQANWKSIFACCIINICVSIMGGFLAFHIVVSGRFSGSIAYLFPVIYGMYSLYLWFSPVSVSCNLIMTQYLNTITKMVKVWSKNCITPSTSSNTLATSAVVRNFSLHPEPIFTKKKYKVSISIFSGCNY